MTNYNLPENKSLMLRASSLRVRVTLIINVHEGKTKFSSPSLHLYLSHNILSVAL